MKQYLLIASMLLFHNSFVLGSEETLKLQYDDLKAYTINSISEWNDIEASIVTQYKYRRPSTATYIRSFAILNENYRNAAESAISTQNVKVMTSVRATHPYGLAKFLFTPNYDLNNITATEIVRIDASENLLRALKYDDAR
jgi:hypothetical protein